MSGTAVLGTDYKLSGGPQPGQVTIAAGQSSAAVALKSAPDQQSESTETATMTLQRGGGYKLAEQKEATVSILNGQ